MVMEIYLNLSASNLNLFVNKIRFIRIYFTESPTSTRSSSEQNTRKRPVFISDYDDLDETLEREDSPFDYKQHQTTGSEGTLLLEEKIQKNRLINSVDEEVIIFKSYYDDNNSIVDEIRKQDGVNNDKNNFAEDAKIIEDAIAELDENLSNKNENIEQSSVELSKQYTKDTKGVH